MKKTPLIITTVILSGCVSSNVDNQPELRIANFPIVPSDAECTIFDSRNWQAQLTSSSVKDNAYTLTIEGEIDLPSPAYQVQWYVGRTDRANPPSQRLQLTTKNSSDGASIQVITSTQISYELETPLAAMNSVLISCGESVIATIPVTHTNKPSS